MPVHIHEYTDYRAYLKAWFAEPDTPTQSAFAQQVGRAKASITAILKGDRELRPTMVSTWARALGLDQQETAYLAALVDLESDALARRRAAWVYVKAAQLMRSADPFDDTVLEIYRQWHLGAILELARIEGFRDDPRWVAERLMPSIPVEDAADGLEELKRRGLLAQAPDGRWKPTRQLLVTPADIPQGLLSQAVLAGYRSGFERAQAALISTRGAERRVSQVMAAISASTLQRVTHRLVEFERELVGMVTDDPDPERVYQVGFVLFPVSRRPGDGPDDG